MDSPALKRLPQLFSDLSVQSLRVGLRAEETAESEARHNPDLLWQGFQVAAINFCVSIEAAAKCIITEAFPLALFDLTNRKDGKRVQPSAMVRMSKSDFSKNDLHKMLMVHDVLGFHESLQAAQDIATGLVYPVQPLTLKEARNQAIHSIVIDDMREADLLAVTALYMHRFLCDAGLVEKGVPVRGLDYGRLDQFLEDRRDAAQKAHEKIAGARRGKATSGGNPAKHELDVSTEDRVFVRCSVCGARAMLRLDEASVLGRGLIVLTGRDLLIRHAQPSILSCPGCGLQLEGLEISEASFAYEIM